MEGSELKIYYLQSDYLRRYLPVLKNYPTRYIHEPWTAPKDVQKSARCIVGQVRIMPRKGGGPSTFSDTFFCEEKNLFLFAKFHKILF